MPCVCGHAVCECGDVCRCCPYVCRCSQCYKLRRRLRANCLLHRTCPLNPKSNLPRTDLQQSSRVSGKPNLGRLVPETNQGSSTASRRCVPETSHSPPRESHTFDDSLIYQMGDIDPPPEVSTNTSTGAKSRIFHGGSHLIFNKSISDTPLELREPPSRGRRRYPHSGDADNLKWSESTKCKTPVPLQKIDDVTCLKLKESRESEVPIITQNVAGCSHHKFDTSISEIEESWVRGLRPLRHLAVTDLNLTELLERKIQSIYQNISDCSHHNPNTNISKLEESQVTEISLEHKFDATDLKWTESQESEMMITKDIPGCLYDYNYVSQQEESQITYNASYAVSTSEDEYASAYLPSTFFPDDYAIRIIPPPSSFSVSPRSPTHPLSTSFPSVIELLPQPTELKSSKQKTSTVLGTSKQSSTSYLSKFEALRISKSHPGKSRASSKLSSIKILPENVPNLARYDTFHGQPGIPSLFVASSQLNNSVMRADSSKPGTSQTLPTSNSLKLPSSEVSKSTKQRFSESD